MLPSTTGNMKVPPIKPMILAFRVLNMIETFKPTRMQITAAAMM
jgi:hypothetical protein